MIAALPIIISAIFGILQIAGIGIFAFEFAKYGGFQNLGKLAADTTKAGDKAANAVNDAPSIVPLVVVLVVGWAAIKEI